MAGDAVRGLSETYALFGALPDAARDQVGVELAIIARDVLAAERAAAPQLTGYLSSNLSIALSLDELRVRIGLIGLTGLRSDLFYGRIIEFGRKAQVVLVQRRRRVNGRLRTENRRKRASDIASTYALRVRAEPPHPFVLSAAATRDAQVTARLANFWPATFDRAGATI